MPAVRRRAFTRIVTLATALGSILSLQSAALFSGALAQEVREQLVGQPGQTLPLHLDLPAARSGAESHGFIRIHGLPPAFTLNRGFPTGGAWFVSLEDAGGLALSTPPNFEGKVELTIKLVQDPKTAPQTWLVMVTLAGKPVPQQAAVTAVPQITAVPHLPSAAETAQLERARELLQSNDVAAARLIFKRLANANVAEAAFELARTYDPDFLKTLLVIGLEPNPALAQHWYERAAELGNGDAAKRVSELKAH